MSQGVLAPVRLIGLPVELWRQARAHSEAIQRELEIVRVSEPEEAVPNRIARLMKDYDDRFGGIGDSGMEQLQAAAERGDVMIDLTFEVPPSVAEATRTLKSMLSDLDEYCRQGEELMTLATPPELVALREWFLGEFNRQIEDGEDPLPWEDYRNSPRAGLPADVDGHRSTARHGSETIVFEGSLDLATVGALRDEIQERRASDPKEIVVDLADVGFVDSIGIGLLITTHNRLEEEGVDLRLVVPPRIKELLRLSGLLELLEPEDAPAP